MIKIAVIGNNGKISKKLYKVAYSLGKEIAKKNAVLLCGGLGGVMEASANGVKSEGGITIGIIPSLYENKPNKYIDISIHGIDFCLRNLILINSADIVIALKGGAGTLNELTLAYLYEKIIVCIKGYGGWVDKIQKDYLDYRKCSKIHNAKTPKEAVNLGLNLLKKKT